VGASARDDDGDKDPGAMDRGYLVRWDAPGLLSIRGGKLTLALTGARQVLAAVSRASCDLRLPRVVAPPFSLPALSGAPPPGAALRGELEKIVPMVTADRLLATYGARSGELLPLLAAPSARWPLFPGLPHLAAEWQHARRFEWAISFEDFARRRGDLWLLHAVGALGVPSPPFDTAATRPSLHTGPFHGRAA
jgi:glycerol-3-phosphate dehydrogenase